MSYIQSWSQEHECEFQRLGNTGEEGTECSGQKNTAGNLFLFWFSSVVHCQSCTRQTKHHNWEETSLIHTGLTENAAFNRTPELTNIRDICNVKPEYAVESVMQTNWNEQTVEETVDTSADCAHTQDAFTNAYQEGVNNRPYEVQRDADEQSNNNGHDRNKTTACKEAKEVRHVDLVELVVAPCSDQTAEDTDKLVVDFAKCRVNGFISTDDELNNSGSQHGLYSQPGDDSCQSRSTFLVFGHTDCNTQSEQNCHVIDQNTASFDQKQSQHAVSTPASWVDPVTDTHQDTTDWQTCYRQHQRFT